MDFITKVEKENILNQKGRVIWLTGLSGAGKTTIAGALERMLYQNGYITKILDGDILRTGLNANLGFSTEDRNENIRRVAEVSKILIDTGIICINSFISPTNEVRNIARNIIGDKDFVEVYVHAPLEVCEQRDVKGLYKKARAGEVKEFTGISATYEIPQKPDIVIKSYGKTIQESAEELYNFILPKITVLKNKQVQNSEVSSLSV
ncbi:MAG: adenylyl-sulfate kinase [Bacteroidales bacterium]|nr:adenylyl-sulfate kinase [Bacteroidales bacterium]